MTACAQLVNGWVDLESVLGLLQTHQTEVCSCAMFGLNKDLRQPAAWRAK